MTWIHPALFIIGLLGLASLALATERHARHLLGRVPAAPARHRWRLAGWVLLAIGLTAAVYDDQGDIGIGIVHWLGWLSAAGLVLVFGLPHWPWQPPLQATPVRARPIARNDPVPRNQYMRKWIGTGLLSAAALVFVGMLLLQLRLPAGPLP